MPPPAPLPEATAVIRARHKPGRAAHPNKTRGFAQTGIPHPACPPHADWSGISSAATMGAGVERTYVERTYVGAPKPRAMVLTCDTLTL